MRTIFFINFFFVLSIFFTFGADTLKIVFSKSIGSEKYLKYQQYIEKAYKHIHSINAYGIKLEEAEELMKDADGLVLTGGPDVHPRLYHQEQDTSFCDIDEYRDSLEFALLEIAFRKQIPIFAICRGLQILNVYLGGSLYPDIPTFLGTKVEHRCNDPKNQCIHTVKIFPNTQLHQWIGLDSIKVNSFHHQGIKKLADETKPSSLAADGLVESFEWINPDKKPFIIAVQWHPERLEGDTISNILANRFIQMVIETRKNKKK